MHIAHSGSCHDQLGIALTDPVTIVISDLVGEDVASLIRRVEMARNVVVQMRMSMTKHTRSEIPSIAGEESR